MRAGREVGSRRGLVSGFMLFFSNLREIGECCYAFGNDSAEKERNVLSRKRDECRKDRERGPTP